MCNDIGSNSDRVKIEIRAEGITPPPSAKKKKNVH
jgi:hypothetical protein